MVVPVNQGSELALEAPVVLFEGPCLPNPIALGEANYDVSLDSERFLMVVEDAPSRRINMVVNWFDELTERVSVD